MSTVTNNIVTNNQVEVITATMTPKVFIDTVETAGRFHPYHAAIGVPEELPELRVIVSTQKQSPAMKKAGKDALPNVYVRVPTVHITPAIIKERIEELAPYIVSYLQGLEDESIRARYRAGEARIHNEILSLDRILEELDEAGSGLNSETITAWFEEHVSPFLLVALAGKLGQDDPTALTGIQKEQVVTVINSYLTVFISLASGKTMLNAAQRDKMKKCIGVTQCQDTVIGSKFLNRFKRMEIKEAEDLASLGDLSDLGSVEL